MKHSISQTRHRGGWTRLAALLLALGLLAAACGGDDDGDDASGSSTTAPSTDNGDNDDEGDDGAEGDVVTGGEVTIAENFVLSMDPTIAATFGCCGGTATAAVYDTIMAFDWESREFVPRTAESLVPNDDLTEWTLTLKDGITFSDGSPYNADAVVYSVERHREQPRSQDYYPIQTYLDTVEATDDLTVVFTLTMGWSEFPSLLAAGTGMIVNPAAVEAAGENFGLVPGDVGAGAFKISEFTANERVVLERNDDYYDGPAPLDKITIVATPASQSIPDSIRGGTLHGGATVEWMQVAEAEDLGYPSVEMIYPSGLVVLMNSGTYECQGGVPASVCDGVADGEIVEMDTATSDPRVRRAIMHAIDKDLWNERFFDGTAPMDDRVFSETLSYSPDVEGPTYDPEEAMRLVEEAKADGWDGKIHMLGPEDPNMTDGQQTFVAMLQAVGMEPELELSPQSEYRAVIQTDRAFDVYAATWGIGNSEEKFFTAIARNVQNYSYGYDSPEMNAALDEARVALTPDERREAWAKVAEVVAEDAPVGFLGTAPRHFIHSPDLHGLATTGNTIVLFDKAWLAQ